MSELKREAYQKLINEDIALLNEMMPTCNLERQHMIHVLEWSVKAIYDENWRLRAEQAEKQLADIDGFLISAKPDALLFAQLKAELAAKDARIAKAEESEQSWRDANEKLAKYVNGVVTERNELLADTKAKDARIKELTILLNMSKD